MDNQFLFKKRSEVDKKKIVLVKRWEIQVIVFMSAFYRNKTNNLYLNNVSFEVWRLKFLKFSKFFHQFFCYRRSEDGEGDTSYMSYKSSSLDSLQPRPKKQRGLPALPASIGVKGEFVNKIHRYAYEGDVPKLRKHIKKVIK